MSTMAPPPPLAGLPTAVVSLIYAHLPVHVKLTACSRLSHSLAACVIPSSFQFDHFHLSPQLLHSLFVSPRLAALLSSVSSLSVESEGASDKTLLSLLNRPSQAVAVSHPLSPMPGTAPCLFPQLAFYSQRVDGVGFHQSALSSFSQLQRLYVDTRQYDASIVLHFSPSFARLHSVKLHALLSVVHLEALYGLPALTALDLAGCTVLRGDIALHNMPLVSLLEPASATAVIGRLRTLLCPLGEQRVADIVATVRAAKEAAVLEYLRCDDSPLPEQCIVDLLALPSLTALEIHSHNIRWEQPPFASLASSTSPAPSSSLQKLRFVADHDHGEPAHPAPNIDELMSSFLARFNMLHVLDLTLPSALALRDVLPVIAQLSALRRLSIARNKSGAGQVHGVSDNPLVELAGIVQRSQPAFPFLHSLSCHRVTQLEEKALIVLLSHMPMLRVLRVSESSYVGACAVLAASAFCPQLRSMTFIACSKLMLADEHWQQSERQLQRVIDVLLRSRPVRPSTPSLPALRFFSLHVRSGSVGHIGLQRLVELLAGSPLQYFGLSIQALGSVAGNGHAILPLPLIALLEPLPLISLATPNPPQLSSSPSVDSARPYFSYSRQWSESEEARARREQSVITAERLSDEVDSDEQLLFEWMARHRSQQDEQYAHVFNSRVSGRSNITSGKQAFFDDVRIELDSQRRSELTSTTEEKSQHSEDERRCWDLCCMPLWFRKRQL